MEPSLAEGGLNSFVAQQQVTLWGSFLFSLWSCTTSRQEVNCREEESKINSGEIRFGRKGPLSCWTIQQRSRRQTSRLSLSGGHLPLSSSMFLSGFRCRGRGEAWAVHWGGERGGGCAAQLENENRECY
ncbi:hypothetical protein KP509_24G071900 [Ceratopteris richardii]|uniref:Uncharacterized protein n=1 Tax=Ceratopteris richardii TaxID=49495 RepID=A0A8T2RYT4_CERRI|nr:hypothetical protein KP509_24G071900 [Ceratopteris richardii]